MTREELHKESLQADLAVALGEMTPEQRCDIRIEHMMIGLSIRQREVEDAARRLYEQRQTERRNARWYKPWTWPDMLSDMDTGCW